MRCSCKEDGKEDGKHWDLYEFGLDSHRSGRMNSEQPLSQVARESVLDMEAREALG